MSILPVFVFFRERPLRGAPEAQPLQRVSASANAETAGFSSSSCQKHCSSSIVPMGYERSSEFMLMRLSIVETSTP